MIDSASAQKALNAVRSNFAFEVIALSLTAYGYWKNFDVQLPTILVAAIGFVLFGLSAKLLYNSYRRVTAKPLPEIKGDFVPFRGAPGWKPLERRQVTKEIVELVHQSDNKHVLLVSPSGTGKSTMLIDLIPAQIGNYDYRYFDSYENIAHTVLLELDALQLDGNITDRILETIRQIENGEHKKETLFSEIQKIIGSIKLERSALLCFDQVERYFLNFESPENRDNRKIFTEHDVIKAILKALSGHPNMRTLFAIRSEYIFGSLSNMFNVKTNGADIDDYVDFYFLWGINYIDDKNDYSLLSKKLNSEYRGMYLKDRLFKVCAIDDQMKANTFMLNLAGYLFEGLQDRPQFFERLLKPNLSGDEVVDVFLDAAFEGYIAETGSTDRTLFDTVLFALANENKISGQACSLTRLSGLAHYPTADVKETLEYLAAKSLVVSYRSEFKKTYRIAHEKVSDRLLKSDKLDIDSRAIDGIRYLTENRISTENLTQPNEFPSSLDVKAITTFSFSYICVVAFVIFGFLRCLFPQTVFDVINNFGILNFIHAHLKIEYHAFYLEPIMYVPHFITHVAWVSYIDRVNRSYLQYAATGLIKKLCNSLSMVGTILGISVSFTPELFVVPIVAVGAIYGIILMILSRTYNLGGQMKSITFNWGGRSLINVTVVMLLSWYLVKPLFDRGGATMSDPSYVANMFILILFESAVMLWFWQHIKAEQNVRRMWSANLALYDKGRVFGR